MSSQPAPKPAAIDMADMPVQLPSAPAGAAEAPRALLQLRQCFQREAAARAGDALPRRA